MAITDELREYARHFSGIWYSSESNAFICTTGGIQPTTESIRMDEHILAIADRIEAEHAEARRRWMAELDAAREQSFNAGFDDGFASADDWLAQHEDAMREHGWVRLPKDADGEVIRIGDVMEFSRFDIDCPVTREVDGVGVGVFFAWCGERGYEQLDAGSYSHRKQPTVEAVLREFALACEDAGNAGPEVARLAAEYAKRLKLAGEGE